MNDSLRRLFGPFAFAAVMLGCAEGSSGDPPHADVLDASASDLGIPDTAAPDAPRDDLGLDASLDAGTPCATADECSGATPICDRAAGRCVPCSAASDQCPPAQHCVDATHTCERGCRSDEGCSATVASDASTGAGRRCDTVSHTCVECVTDAHCPSGLICVGNTCVVGCNASQPCPGGQLCCSGACADPQTSGVHCGRCDNRCAVPNASAVCAAGACAVGMCMGSFGDCNGSAADGCETNTASDLAHCGGCGMACGARANSTATCEAGSCRYACAAGFGDCDGNPANGCETSVLSDVVHCGACGSICMPPSAIPLCRMGMCGIASCVIGSGDCDNNALNGCETDLNASVSHCGRCGNACPTRPNAVPACAAGACLTTCLSGFADCDGRADNGCEVDVRSSVPNCGGCGRVCAVANAVPSCASSVCRIASCNAGFADCDTSSADGCEVSTQTDPNHCGGCGMRCPVAAHQIASCAAAVCSVRCETGFVDLDRVAGNGCECNTSDPDDPDLSFRDTNCDGIDGTLARAIFVSTRGSDGNPGTMSAPKRSIQAAITLAASLTPRRSVYVARGLYVESITLASGVSVYGGFDDAAGWFRSATNTTVIQGSSTAILAQSILSPIELQLFTITAADASGAGASSYGVRVVNSPATVLIRACDITSGRGADGIAGSPGGSGAVGSRGGDAGRPSAGGGGYSACGSSGGSGGAGVSGGGNNGNRGFDGLGVVFGGGIGRGGSGGRAGGGCCSTTYAQSAAGDNSAGGSGANGSNGAASASLGGLRTDTGIYEPPVAGSGSDGRAGGGGGGGGSGGGDGSGCPFSCGNDTSGGGGGGGGGGCGGSGGRAGTSAGGSMAIVSVASVVQVEDTQLRARDGGRGGNGGAGGAGGAGGGGGVGGIGGGSAGNGRAGESGGAGGYAGNGAGGAGGPSVCVLYAGAAPAVRGGTCTLGSPGPGGTGGANVGLGVAPAGPSGVAAALRSAP